MAECRPEVRGFYDAATSSVQYVVACPRIRRCAIVDPVLDFDPASGATATRSADAILAQVAASGLTVEWILDTHPHADHFSAAHYLHERTGAPTAIGVHVRGMQRLWADIYGFDWECDGSHWDRLFAHGDTFAIGDLEARVLHSPGHTPASVTYVVADAAFVHDTLFMPDSGSARTDFPGGDATQLYRSIRDILALPDATRVFVGHDYGEGGRVPRWESTVAEQRATNIHFAAEPACADYVAVRRSRDATLPIPRLMLAALQVNLRGGRLPEPDAAGRRHLRIPLDTFAAKA